MPTPSVIARGIRFFVCSFALALPAAAANLASTLTLDGTAAGEHFGCSAAIVGDVNDDSYDDFIVGAYGAATHGSYSGRAYVYFGGPGLDGIADLVLEGTAANEWFGTTVSAAGDLNDDTYPDFAVAALQLTSGGAGRVLVYYGGPSVDAVADLELQGEAGGDRFGWAMTAAGDLDDDGIDDLVVGATRHDATFNDAGRVYLFSGGASPSTTASLTFDGAGFEAEFGSSVVAGQDWDGDGQPDLVVGARLHPDPLADAGRVYFYRAGSALDDQADLFFPASTSDGSFGQSLAFLDDMDGDGRAEILIGSSGYESGRGAAYVFSSGPAPDTGVDLVLQGDSAGDAFGFRVADLGDFDADGIVDYAISAIYDDEGGLDTGTVSVFAHPFDPPLYTMTEPIQGEQWIAGTSRVVAWTGASYPAIHMSVDDGATWNLLLEVNRGGTSSLVKTPAIDAPSVRLAVGIPGQPVSALSAFIAPSTISFVLPEPPHTALTQAQGTSSPNDGTSDFGVSVAYLGDINGFSNEDLLVGSPFDSSGEARLFLSTPLGQNWNLTFDRHTNDGQFGSVVAAVGDVDDDGFADWAIASPEYSAGATDIGRVYVYLGGSSLSTAADLTLTGDLAGHDEFGHDVCAAGDVNGDGFDDFAVAASSLNALSDDEVYMYFGGPSLDGVADRVFNSHDPNDFFGSAISGIGDVNGDGFDDFAIGSPHEYSSHGVVFVYYGSPVFDTSSYLEIEAPVPFTRLGYEVSAAGDLNGDGYDDMAVGADYMRTFVFFGGPSFGFTPPWILDVGSSCSNCPPSLAGGADLNGDGYDDLVVGVEPTVYVYYGGPTPDGIADVILNEPGGADFGAAISVLEAPTTGGLGLLAVGDPSFDFDSWSVAGRGRLHTYRFLRYELLGPVFGEVWRSGQTEMVQWEGTALADVELSLDDGVTFDVLVSGVGGQAVNAIEITVPAMTSNEARIRVRPTDPTLLGEALSAKFTIEGATGVDGDLPLADWLGAPRPNPFPAGRPVVFPASLRQGGAVELRVFDVRGRRVATLQGRFEPGFVSFRWQPDQRMASGIYFAQMSRDGQTVATTRWTLLQ